MEVAPPEPAALFQVRNTFIDTCAIRSPSVEEFFREREVHTAPSRQIGQLRGLFQDPPEAEAPPAEAPRDVPPWRRRAVAAGRDRVKAAPCGAISAGSSIDTTASDGRTPPSVPPRIRLADAVMGAGDPEPIPGAPSGSLQLPAQFHSSQVPPYVEPLSLLSVIGSPMVPYVQMAENPFQPQFESASAGFARGPPPASPAPPVAPPAAPAPGSADVPTIGSAAHGTGRCKPCAFVHAAGCSNGVACQFCHLCDAGEKKRRRKEKLEARKAFGEMRVRRYARS